MHIIPMKLSDMKHTSIHFVKIIYILVRFVDQDGTKLPLVLSFIQQYS
jgi:hypothetical protein